MKPCIAIARTLLLGMLLAVAGGAIAQTSDPTPLQFADSAEEARFHRLTSQLRCVMCQNQSLADSSAQIAHDLRREVLELMRQGKSDREVKQFLVERYGEFVLYKPEVTPGTWLLWFGPLLLVLAGGLVVWRILRRGKASRAAVGSDDNQEW
jgi:cytochrome c-type biogenesis protein CcmH